MVPRREYFANLDLVERLDLPAGCVIECGVWRGGMIAGLATVLGAHRSYLLFDSFEGLPPAGELDGLAAKRYQSDPSGPWYFDNCRAERAFAERAMGLSGAKLYCLKKGWYSDTLPSFVPSEPVALLRLDADWYESTMCCLESLFDHVAPGGLILIDDYFAWDGCSRAVHDFLSRRSALERIQTFRGVCFIRKAQPQQLKQ
jgi:O-methyltransferase